MKKKVISIGLLLVVLFNASYSNPTIIGEFEEAKSEHKNLNSDDVIVKSENFAAGLAIGAALIGAYAAGYGIGYLANEGYVEIPADQSVNKMEFSKFDSK